MSIRSNKLTFFRVALLISISFLFSGCSSQSSRYALKNDTGPDRYVNHNNVADAIPRKEKKSRGGNKNYRVLGKNYRVLDSSKGYKQRGIASWYGKKFHGHRTSNGEVYDMYQMSAAHKSLPLPTFVRVTHLKNGRSVVLRVNDRGPFHRNRLIDLSYVAAKKLGITATGTGLVEVEAINPENYNQRANNNSRNTNASPNSDRFSTSNSNYQVFLQVGAFSQAQNAKALLQRVARLGLDYKLKIEFDKSQALYKVKLGPFTSVKDADSITEQLDYSQNLHAYIVID